MKNLKEKLEKEKEADIKNLKDKNKELKTKIKNLTTNQITNNFGKITITNWECKTWKIHNQK